MEGCGCGTQGPSEVQIVALPPREIKRGTAHFNAKIFPKNDEKTNKVNFLRINMVEESTREAAGISCKQLRIILV